MTAADPFRRLLHSLLQDRIDLARCARVLPSQVIAPASTRRLQGVLLGSGVLVYRWIDVSTVPKARRRAAVAAQARAWSPFGDSGFVVAWFGDSAGIYAWDAQRLRQRLEMAGLPFGERWSVVPEPWLDGVMADGPRLVQGAEGTEGQWWQQGTLRDWRWWPSAPDAAQWLNYLRGAGHGPSDLPPRWERPVDAQTESRAPLLSLAELQASATGWDTVGAAVGSLALMAWTAMLAHDEVQLRSQRSATAAALLSIEARSQPVVALREAALQDAQRAAALTSLVTGPQALQVIEHLLLRLPAKPGVLVRQLEIDGRQVRLTLDVPQAIERSSAVTALEDGGWLSDVREGRESTGNQLVLTMTLRGDRPAALVVQATDTMPGGADPAPAASEQSGAAGSRR